MFCFTCIRCGKEFRRKSVGKRRKFCSAKCYHDSRQNRVTGKCVGCGCELVRTQSRLSAVNWFCSKRCRGNFQVGSGNANWKGGRWIQNGKRYSYVVRNVSRNKKTSESRMVMELKVGRSLTFNDCVHHINGNPFDNREENLQLMTRSEHSKLHAAKIKRGANGAFLR